MENSADSRNKRQRARMWHFRDIATESKRDLSET